MTFLLNDDIDTQITRKWESDIFIATLEDYKNDRINFTSYFKDLFPDGNVPRSPKKLAINYMSGRSISDELVV